MEDHIGVPGARIKIKVGSSGDLVHVLYFHVEFARSNPISNDQVLSLRLCLHLDLLLPQSSL
jgi:hypothetical protein